MSNADTKAALADRKTEIAERNGEQGKQVERRPNIYTLLKKDEVMTTFAEVLPRGGRITAEQLRQDIIIACKNAPDLVECDGAEVLGGALTFAQLGLRPGSGTGHGWLLPFKNWRKKVMQCQTIIGYQGLADLTYRSKIVTNLYAETVHENDLFDVDYGLHRDLKHRRPPRGKPRGEVWAYYTIAQFLDGPPRFEFITKEEAEAHRDRYAMAKRPIWRNGKKTDELEIVGPWRDNFDAMAKKTALRAMLKLMPKSLDMGYALHADNRIRREWQSPDGITGGLLPEDEGLFDDVDGLGAEFPDIGGVPHGETVEGEVGASPEQVRNIAELFTKCGVEAPGEIVKYAALIGGADPEQVRNLPDLSSEQAAVVARKVGQCADAGADAANALDQLVGEYLTQAG